MNITIQKRGAANSCIKRSIKSIEYLNACMISMPESVTGGTLETQCRIAVALYSAENKYAVSNF
jgi:hypothetical protein